MSELYASHCAARRRAFDLAVMVAAPREQQALRTLEWVHRRENLSVCGPSGTGKSHLCEALGQAAVDSGLTVAWFTIEDLGALVRKHRPDDSMAKATDRIIRTDLIIVDNIGLLPVSAEAAEGFYRLVDACAVPNLVSGVVSCTFVAVLRLPCCIR